MPIVVVHSDDGRAWQAVGSAPSNIMDVAAGGPGIVAVGSDSTPPGHAVIWLSADGSTWTRAPGDEALFPRGIVMSIARRSGTLVAIGTDYMQPRSQGVVSFVWTSTDGEHWTLHSNALAGGSPQTITASDTEFLIGGATFKPTTGPSSTTTMTTPPRTAATEPTPGCQNVASVDTTLGTAQPTTWTSTDGVTWRPRVSATSPLSEGRVVVATNGWWVAGGLADPAITPGWRDLGDAGTWVSPDGITWVPGLTERLPPGRCGPFARIVRAVAPTATGAVVAVDSWALPAGPDVLPAPDIWLWTAPK
jgi:hypothetical protein